MKVQNDIGLVTKLPIKNKEGKIVGYKEVVTYRGLLARAHDEGLKEIQTTIVQLPAEENRRTAVVQSKVTTSKGTFTGVGDASPENVRANIAPHLIRMAETRAKARALRDAVNIGVVALEELGELLDDELSYEGMSQNQDKESLTDKGNTQPTKLQAAASSPVAPSSDSPFPPSVSVGPSVPPMSEAQRRMLFRLASQSGIKPEEAKPWLERALGGRSLREATKAEASRLIDLLQAQKGNGNIHSYQQEARP